MTQQQRLSLGKATEFFRSWAINRHGVNKPGTPGVNWSAISDLEYLTILEDGGYSQSYIDTELENLRKYRQALNTEGVRGARRRLLQTQEAEADPILENYMAADKRRRSRKQTTKEQADGTET